MKKSFLLFVLLIMVFAAQAQETEDQDDRDIRLQALPYYSFGKGVGLTSPDSIFQFNIRFRMQNRLTYYKNEGDEGQIEAAIRRLRLRFDGYVGNPMFVYVIQLSFSPGDVGVIRSEENLNIIRDAIVFYRPNKHWNIGFGQTKLPGNRQRVNSSGALQFTDRTINNALFNIDRDFGIQVYYLNEQEDNFYYNLKGAISTGEGRNWTREPDTGLAYTGRLELYPFGAFKNNGAYFEGDILRESRPKLMLSGTYHYNDDARRTRGTVGNILYDYRDMSSLLLDAILKYNGWAVMGAYMNRKSPDPITVNPEDPQDERFVFVGHGFDTQLSYVFRKNYELIGRFSRQVPDEDIADLAPRDIQYSMGITKYIWEHSFKLQLELTGNQLKFIDNSTQNLFYARFQVEIGI